MTDAERTRIRRVFLAAEASLAAGLVVGVMGKLLALLLLGVLASTVLVIVGSLMSTRGARGTTRFAAWGAIVCLGSALVAGAIGSRVANDDPRVGIAIMVLEATAAACVMRLARTALAGVVAVIGFAGVVAFAAITRNGDSIGVYFAVWLTRSVLAMLVFARSVNASRRRFRAGAVAASASLVTFAYPFWWAYREYDLAQAASSLGFSHTGATPWKPVLVLLAAMVGGVVLFHRLAPRRTT